MAENLKSDISRSIFWPANKKEINLTHLKATLEKYKKAQDLLRDKMRELGTERLQEKVKFHVLENFDIYQTEFDREYTIQELISSDFKSLVKGLEDRSVIEKDSKILTQFSGLKSLYLKARQRRKNC